MNQEIEKPKVKIWDEATMPPSEPQTEWTNAHDFEQSVVVQIPKKVRVVDKETGRVREFELNESQRIVWAPGQTRSIPRIWDGAIHRVLACNHGGDCRGVCVDPANAGPSAMLAGGLAPLLTRNGQKYGLDPSLTEHLRPTAQRSMAEASSTSAPEAADPTLERARARRAAR